MPGSFFLRSHTYLSHFLPEAFLTVRKNSGRFRRQGFPLPEPPDSSDPPNAPDGRKVKGTIHWVEASQAGQATVRLYENIVDEEKGVYNKEDGSLNLNPNSLTTVTAYVEPELMKAKGYDSFQFVRNGFFCADIHDSKEGQPVFNRIVSLKSSFKLPKA